MSLLSASWLTTFKVQAVTACVTDDHVPLAFFSNALGALHV